MQKITPCLWFDDKAEEAMKFYLSIFKNSKIGHMGEGFRETQGVSHDCDV
ncbi:MAG TPA: VOC family protein [Nitrospiraceae bacterium]|jgi:predicted 3-demethylubiquinone-9 3-methyltransferase (glyoxalase superfamily)